MENQPGGPDKAPFMHRFRRQLGNAAMHVYYGYAMWLANLDYDPATAPTLGVCDDLEGWTNGSRDEFPPVITEEHLATYYRHVEQKRNE